MHVLGARILLCCAAGHVGTEPGEEVPGVAEPRLLQPAPRGPGVPTLKGNQSDRTILHGICKFALCRAELHVFATCSRSRLGKTGAEAAKKFCGTPALVYNVNEGLGKYTSDYVN